MDQNIRDAVNHLKNGHVILYPTDTIWGLGCDPKDQDAVDRIFDIKKRKKNKPLILLVDNIERLRTLVPVIHPHLENILHYNERPLTIIFKSSTITWADGITAENGSIAIRIVKNDFCKKVIASLNSPLVSTSANISTQPFPKSFDEISREIKDSVDHIVTQEAGIDSVEPSPSVIAKYSAKQKELIFLRQ